MPELSTKLECLFCAKHGSFQASPLGVLERACKRGKKDEEVKWRWWSNVIPAYMTLEPLIEYASLGFIQKKLPSMHDSWSHEPLSRDAVFTSKVLEWEIAQYLDYGKIIRELRRGRWLKTFSWARKWTIHDSAFSHPRSLSIDRLRGTKWILFTCSLASSMFA